MIGPTCPATQVWDVPGGPYRLACVLPAGHEGEHYGEVEVIDTREQAEADECKTRRA